LPSGNRSIVNNCSRYADSAWIFGRNSVPCDRRSQRLPSAGYTWAKAMGRTPVARKEVNWAMSDLPHSG